MMSMNDTGSGGAGSGVGGGRRPIKGFTPYPLPSVPTVYRYVPPPKPIPASAAVPEVKSVLPSIKATPQQSVLVASAPGATPILYTVQVNPTGVPFGSPGAGTSGGLATPAPTVISGGTTGAPIASTTSGVSGFVDNTLLPSLFDTTAQGTKAPNWSNIVAAAAVIYFLFRAVK